MRRITRTCALFLLPALLVTAFAATASAVHSPTADPKPAAVQVYGERTWPLEHGIAYWNKAAGRTVISYAGRHAAPAVASDPHTVVVNTAALNGLSGVTAGVYGQTSRVITIDTRYMFQWGVYAHHFGQVLGLRPRTEPGYDGVMASASMWDPSPNADKSLLISYGDAF